MNHAKRDACRIIKNEQIAEDIFELVIESQEISNEASPGQFLNIYLPGGAMLLPRPISIAGADKTTGTVSLVYAVVGDGTKALSTLSSTTGANASIQSANFIYVLGPLGKGFFDYEGSVNLNKVILIGGGVGIPPLHFAAQRLSETFGPAVETKAILGYREAPWLEDRFTTVCNSVSTISEDPAAQTQTGNVVDLLNIKRSEIIAPAKVTDSTSTNGILAISCGPKPMLAAVAAWCEQNKINLRVSLEERMGCGYGACAGCTTKTLKLDDPAKPQNGPSQPGENGIIKKKICVHGPVFWADEVVW